MKKALEEPDQPSTKISARSGVRGKVGSWSLQCDVALGLQYGQFESHSLSEKTAISYSDVSSVPSKGSLSGATLFPAGTTKLSELPNAL